MTNALTEFMAQCDREARPVVGTPATFGVGPLTYGQAAVILAPAQSELAFAAGGAEVHVKFKATVRRDSLERSPEEGHVLTIEGRRYYIVGVSAPPYDPLYTLTLAN